MVRDYKDKKVLDLDTDGNYFNIYHLILVEQV